MKRRDVLRTSAAAVGGGAGVLGVTRWLGGDASAAASLTLAVTGDSTTVGTDEAVTAVRLDLDAEWAYELPSSATPATVVVEIAAGAAGEDHVTLATADSAALFTEGDGTESFDVDLLDDVVDADGAETVVTIEAAFRVEDADGGVLADATATDEATVRIDRAADGAASVGGDGVITIETE